MASTRDLNELARLYGLQTAYEDVSGRRQATARDALLRVLRVMGAPVESANDVSESLRQRQSWLQEQLIEPTIVAWNGLLRDVALRLRPAETGQTIVTCITTEQGERKEQRWNSAELRSSPVPGEAVKDSGLCLLPIREKLSLGYHRLCVTIGQRSKEALIIAAPRRLITGSMAAHQRRWGVFAPMYALHGHTSWDAGSITQFDQFAGWVRGQGGTLVASLPLLASFFDNSWDVSPYSPASRLFWNEFFVDVTEAPEFAFCPEARQIIESTDFQQQIQELRAKDRVDYMRLMKLKRRVLEQLANRFFAEPAARRDEFEAYRRTSPDLENYARFRAVCERLGRPWMRWPEQQRDGNLPDVPLDQLPLYQYHLYVQWLAQQQLGKLSRSAAASGMMWYLDLPLGTHPDGYDVWRYRDVFALGVSGGAPPDAFFTKGQSWGFPPLHPLRLREQYYDYFIRVIRHHLGQARLLRIDHVMGLHRLYWVPDGSPASQGVYVKYPAEELYAVLLLEAHRHGASIIGENLGTVPLYVNRAMRQHGFGRLYVLQYEMHLPASDGRARAPDADEVASLNTHDMPPFAAWWQGKDIDDRLDLGLLDEAQADFERADREHLRQSLMGLLREQGALQQDESDLPAVLRACLQWLASSDAPVVLVNLEDLWLETKPQNVPGTLSERVNWQRKTKLSLDHILHAQDISALLQEVDRRRKEQRGRREGGTE